MGLHWEAPYAIVLALAARHPAADVESIGLQELHRMIVSLPDFDDNPKTVSDEALSDILVEWYEEVNPPL